MSSMGWIVTELGAAGLAGFLGRNTRKMSKHRHMLGVRSVKEKLEMYTKGRWCRRSKLGREVEVQREKAI